MLFQIFLAYPPDRDCRIAELHVETGPGSVEIPAEVFGSGDGLMVTIFSPEAGPAWTYPLEEFRGALDRAASLVTDGPT